MADEEKKPTTAPIVERWPTSEYPHPPTGGMPPGSVGHPGPDGEMEPVEDGNEVVAAPPGHGVEIRTIPSEEEVERLLRQPSSKSQRWFGGFLQRLKRKAESGGLESAA